MKNTKSYQRRLCLPNGRGKDVKIGVFASGDMALGLKGKLVCI